MLKQIIKLGKRPGTRWVVLDCSQDDLRPVEAKQGDVIPVGGDDDWLLECFADFAVFRCEKSHASVCFNGKWIHDGNDHKLKPGGDYTVVIPSEDGGLPLLICGDGEADWANQDLSASINIMQRQGVSEGPFNSLQAARRRLVAGQVYRDGMLWVESSAVAFFLRDLWPEVIDEEDADEDEEDDFDSEEIGNETEIKGGLVCPYCRFSFKAGHCLYFSPAGSPGVHDPPFLPDAWDRKHRLPLDKYGKICEERACPHCQQALPKSFGRSEYRYFSLVGQSGSGKSYYLATLFHQLPAMLDRMGLGFIGDVAELNQEISDLSSIPFRGGPPANRMIEKTDNRVSTQLKVKMRGEDEERSIPKPFIFRMGSGRREEPKRIVFYDNPGEHFTTVERGSALSEQARIAASHIAFASVIFVLYDPLLDSGFLEALGMPESGEGDAQRTMLDMLPERMEEVRNREGSTIDKDIPLVVLVGKWDAWEKLAPDLVEVEQYITEDEKLDLDVVKSNSAVLTKLLNDYHTGLPAAVSMISSEVVYFPVSAIGEVGLDSGSWGNSPAAPVKPWGVEIPFLWAAWRTYPDLIPTTGAGSDS